MKQLIKHLSRAPLAALARRRLRHFQRGSALDATLARALLETLDDVCSPEERRWVDRIESLRRRLLTSTDRVRRVDFGAKPQEEGQGAGANGVESYDAVADLCRNLSKPYFWSLLLFKLVRAFRPDACLEMGTCLGMSALYQAAALELNGQGRLCSLEGSQSLAERARAHAAALGLERVEVVVGRFAETLDPVMARLAPISYAFIDGHHDEQATLEYFERLLPHLGPSALLVFDDITWSDGMERAWRTLEQHPRVARALNLRNLGLCVIDHSLGDRKCLRIPLV